jgi:hypothetical protein
MINNKNLNVIDPNLPTAIQNARTQNALDMQLIRHNSMINIANESI